jgi:hypothetical protein
VYIAEAVLQGIRRFEATIKFSLKPGLNLIYGKNETGKTTLYETVRACLEKEYFDSARGSFITWVGSDAAKSKAGILLAEGETRVRLMRDFQTAQSSLSRHNPADNTFQGIAKTTEEVEIEVDSNVCPKGLRRALGLIFIDYSEMASFFSPHAPAEISPDQPQILEEAPLVQGQPEDVEELKKSRDSLRKQVETGGELEQLQFQHDGVHQKLFELDSKLKEINDKEKALADMDEFLEKNSSLANMPDGIEAKLNNFKDVEENRKKEVGKLGREIGDLEHELAGMVPTPFYKEMLFIAGVGVFIAFFAGQIVIGHMDVTGTLATISKFFPIGWIGGILTTAVALWMTISRKDKRKKAEQELVSKRDKIKVVDKKFEIESQVVTNLLKSSGSQNAHEFKEKLDKYKSSAVKRKQMAADIKKLKDELGFEKVMEEREKLKVECDQIDAKLEEHGSTIINMDQAKNELAEVEARLSAALEASAAGARPEPQSPVISAAGVEVHRVFRSWLDVTGFDSGAIENELNEALKRNLAAVCKGTYELEALRPEGWISLRHAKSGRVLAPGEISQAARSAVFNSLVVSLLEAGAGRIDVPVLLDEPFHDLDDERGKQLFSAVKEAAKSTQIIVMSRNVSLAKLSEYTISVK